METGLHTSYPVVVNVSFARSPPVANPTASRAKRLIRDGDGIYGAAFDRRVNHLGITQFRPALRFPWQNGYVERVVGTYRREVVGHLIVLNELRLLRRLREYVRYYNEDRPHMSLDGDAPARRTIEPAANGIVVALPRLGGRHHRYTRRAA